MAFDLSESETERYDRQIRVWGAEAQGRIQNSKALICGFNKINVEVVKNIVLAGVNLTIQDSNLVTYEDLAYNFFLTSNDVSKEIAPTVLPKVKELNSFASVDCVTTKLDDLPDEFFSQYSVVLMSGCSESQALRVNALTRARQPQAVFFWSDVFGEEGLFYSDFGDSFQYKDDAQQSNNASSSGSSSTAAPVVKQIKTIQFPSLHHILNRRWKEIPSKLFPLSPTFVKHRVLTKFRDGHQRNPQSGDVVQLSNILCAFEKEYDINQDNQSHVVDEATIQALCSTADATSVMACSVLGSFLSQEVIKAVSMTGMPGYNVFVFSGSDFVAKAIPI